MRLEAVGVMRHYERDADGEDWHDGLLMELLRHAESTCPAPLAAEELRDAVACGLPLPPPQPATRS